MKHIDYQVNHATSIRVVKVTDHTYNVYVTVGDSEICGHADIDKDLAEGWNLITWDETTASGEQLIEELEEKCEDIVRRCHAMPGNGAKHNVWNWTSAGVSQDCATSALAKFAVDYYDSEMDGEYQELITEQFLPGKPFARENWTWVKLMTALFSRSLPDTGAYMLTGWQGKDGEADVVEHVFVDPDCHHHYARRIIGGHQVHENMTLRTAIDLIIKDVPEGKDVIYYEIAMYDPKDEKFKHLVDWLV